MREPGAWPIAMEMAERNRTRRTIVRYLETDLGGQSGTDSVDPGADPLDPEQPGIPIHDDWAQDESD